MYVLLERWLSSVAVVSRVTNGYFGYFGYLVHAWYTHLWYTSPLGIHSILKYTYTLPLNLAIVYLQVYKYTKIFLVLIKHSKVVVVMVKVMVAVPNGESG